ncbi:DUF6166 domain-containing protein [Sphaerisporangium melleum]|uniref:DUF6166 domain-containing protein n=1 Tax=Sphaerisporangium melleum TaxID=321316 RepID=UPI003557C9B8
MARWIVIEFTKKGLSRGSRINKRYPTYDKFVQEDQRRSNRRQIDFGVCWSEGPSRGVRVTWHAGSGELVAAGAGNGEPVEVIATIQSEHEILHRLENFEYASPSLRWVRRRACGWSVPLPPRGKRWLIEDSRKPEPRPTPPPASAPRAVGAYLGRKDVGPGEVLISDIEGQRPLYHHLAHSPTGFSWGYTGEGPHDLARSVLADRLGWVPNMLIYSEFCNDVVYRLPDDFILKFEEVDKWIREHSCLIGRNPKADLSDPIAAGR